MRAFRLVVVSLLVVAGATTAAAPSAYADSEASLGVSPNNGSPDAAFTAIARWQPPKHGRNRQCTPDQVTFTWDGAALGEAPAARAGDACVAILRATPPPGQYDGTSAHVIGVSGLRAARTRYVVVAGATAPTAAATDATTTPDAATPTDLPSLDPQSTGPAAVTAPTGAATAAKANSTGLSGTSQLIIAFGILLFLAGVAALGALVWRARRARVEDGTQTFPADLTQPIPMDATQPLVDPTRPMPLPRQPGDSDTTQTFQFWPPRSGGQRGE
ncbi:hypothetical protein HC031_06755 [Planosporangium thailandense]|uniref:Uncharacterized protein n=1 Tax=Planosporangium thailandense TaxID=765197 RepID=A0ABX0XTV5_9ACTN|nr:hypothetical protein [Planosporangium thailandense]NJC69420.1 hypothetical protein [Planosporangium thailandense]